jgi:probable F420-dependent oxidoreductase
MAKMIFSVGGSSGLGWRDYLDVAHACDELSFHGFYPSDHLGPIQAGRGPDDRLDAMTVLAALAGHTQRLRLGAMVMGNGFRHPVITAKTVGALDHVSDGRAELGLGAGNVAHEYVNHGMEFPAFKERAERLDEALTLIRALWTQDEPSFEGRYYRVQGVQYYPKPVQKPYPPIMIGGTGPTMIRIAAKHADEWNTTGVPLKSQVSLMERMRAACSEAGRDFSALRFSHQLTIEPAKDRTDAQTKLDRHIGIASRNPRFKLRPEYTSLEEQVQDSVIVGEPAEIVERVGQWRDAGITHLNMHTPRPFERGVLETIARDVMPAFSS